LGFGEMMLLSIVIVSWNTKKLLEQCLCSIYQFPPDCDYEIWVVDNASTDGSVELVKEQYPDVKLIANETNGGFATGNNQAIARCSGSYILLLNPDTEVRAGALKVLVDFMETHPEAGGAGSMLVSPDGSMQTSCHPELTLARELWRLFHLDVLYPYGRYRMHEWDKTKPRRVDGAQGASLILRKEALDRVGYFDDGYFMYTEEVDLCYRLRKGGWPLYWVPKSIVLHYGGESTKLVAEKMFIRLYQSRLLYFRKHHGWFGGTGYKVILLIAALARLSLTPFALLMNQSQRARNLTLANNYTKLLVNLPRLEAYG
jgi:GT2 family glycosyltransferase